MQHYEISSADVYLPILIYNHSCIKHYINKTNNNSKTNSYFGTGARYCYVEEDQDGFDGVERVSIAKLEIIDNGTESNGGYGMYQEWKQELSMMEGIKFATQIGKAHRAFEPLPGSKLSIAQCAIVR